MNDVPERINVIRTFTYDVASIKSEAIKGGIELSSIDDVINYISEWIYQDMISPPSRHELVYQDENGEEL